MVDQGFLLQGKETPTQLHQRVLLKKYIDVRIISYCELLWDKILIVSTYQLIWVKISE